MAWSPVYPWRSHVHFSVVLPSPPHATTPQPIHDTLRPQLASVQFHLLTTTALFISREGFRRGCLRFGAAGVGAGGDNAETPDAKVKEVGRKKEREREGKIHRSGRLFWVSDP
ncbi:hypothetical protein Vretifemale_20251 [Volvox reticuliferus]|uniref:Protein RFT1 homolog n=1 Tax=Volvox reticuliferus TaxID=1737510 RepID=A0A8J4D522_9CHLO|nr:hypothetical protein Vretifemale_20251 [Volvox reticuliferus]